jgi:hypothetical protein
MNDIMSNYFGGSVKQLVSFFTKNKNIDLGEADEIIKMLEELKSNNHE